MIAIFCRISMIGTHQCPKQGYKNRKHCSKV